MAVPEDDRLSHSDYTRRNRQVNRVSPRILYKSQNRRTMPLMPDALKNHVVQRVKELGCTLPAAAERCGIPYSTFISVYYGTRKRPGPEVLNGLSRGLGSSYRQLALAAYGIIADGNDPADADNTASLEETPPADSMERKAWPPPRQHGTRLQRASAGIS